MGRVMTRPQDRKKLLATMNKFTAPLRPSSPTQFKSPAKKSSAHRSSAQHAAEEKLAVLKQMKAKANAYADTVGVVKKPQSPESKFADQHRKNLLAAKIAAAGGGQHEHRAL
jgi:hypothetical protein